MKRAVILSILLAAALFIAAVAQAEAPEDDTINQRISSGQSLTYAWRDQAGDWHPGTVEVTGCVFRGAIYMRVIYSNGYSWYEYTYPLYEREYKTETVAMPWVEWYDTCTAAVHSGMGNKYLAYPIYTPLLTDNAYPYP